MTLRTHYFGLGSTVLPVFAALAMSFAGAGSSRGAEAAAVDSPEVKEAAADDGFVKLFEGDKDKTWVGYNKDAWPEGWELEGQILHRNSGGGDLQTREEFGDFDLRFGWKVSAGGNSGVMYRVSRERGPAYETGPEYQILDNARHKDGKNPLTSTGSLYALYAPAKEVAKPVGKWNRSRIVVEGNHVRHFLNGEKVVDVEIGSDEWNELVAKSKFAAWPKYGKNPKGFIVLQDHGDEVWFRNMRIKRLDGAAAKAVR